MSEEAPQINIQELYVKDLLPKDFFVNLKSFIFDEPFYEFIKRRTNEKRDYTSFSGIWIDDEYFEDNSELICKFPISFEIFMDMYKNIGVCQKLVDIWLFHIKLSCYILFSKGIKSNCYEIKFDKKLVDIFYDNSILNKLYNSKIVDLAKLNIYKETHFYIKNSNLLNPNLFVKYFIINLFEYIHGYLLSIVENIRPDICALLKSYLFENSVNCIKEDNMSKEKIEYLTNLTLEAKRTKNERLLYRKGAKKKIIIGQYFPATKNELELKIKKIKRQYELIYSEAKDIIDEIIAKPSKAFKLKNELYKRIDLDDYDPETNITLHNVIDFRQQGETASIKYIILYSLLQFSGDIKIFENTNDDGNILERIRKYFERIGNEIKPSGLISNILLYDNIQIKEIYNNFLNNIY